MRTTADEPAGYPLSQIADWSRRATTWQSGQEPHDLQRVRPPDGRKMPPRDVFLFYISGAKERAPAAAVATIEALAR